MPSDYLKSRGTYMFGKNTVYPFMAEVSDAYSWTWRHCDGGKLAIAETVTQLLMADYEPEQCCKEYFGSWKFPQNPDDEEEIYHCAEINRIKLDNWCNSEKQNHMPASILSFVIQAIEIHSGKHFTAHMAERMFPTVRGNASGLDVFGHTRELIEVSAPAFSKLLAIAPNGLGDDSADDLIHARHLVNEFMQKLERMSDELDGELAGRNKKGDA